MKKLLDATTPRSTPAGSRSSAATALDDDDRLRRTSSASSCATSSSTSGEVEARFGIDFDGYFAAELGELDEPRAGRALRRDRRTGSRSPTRGRLFVRNVCMAFDRYLEAKKPDKPVFSRTV